MPDNKDEYDWLSPILSHLQAETIRASILDDIPTDPKDDVNHWEAKQAILAHFKSHQEAEGVRARFTVAGKVIEFAHTAVNGDMHLWIDGYHNPDICPECIEPGILVERPEAQLDAQKEET